MMRSRHTGTIAGFTCWRAGALAVVSAIMVVLALSPHAEASTVFRVDGVVADVTAENVVVAKEQAFAEASSTALSMLYERLARAQDIDRLPEPTTELAERLTAIFQITAEEASLVRYRLRARVTFDPNAVSRLFRQSGVTAFTQPSPPVLIVPVLTEGSAPAAFDDAGDWFEALQLAAEDRSGLVPVKVAIGTLEDRMEPLEFIRSGDRISLDALRLRYDAQGVVVATAERTPGRETVSITIAGQNGAGPVSTEFEAEGSTEAAARQVKAFLEQAWKSNLSRGRSHLTAYQQPDAPYQNLEPSFARHPAASRTLSSGVRVRGERHRSMPFDPVGDGR